MLQPNELRVGNWLYLQPSIPYQITGISSNKLNAISYPAKDYTQSVNMPLSFFIPIPLTEEILLKCGFKKMKQGFIYDDFYYTDGKVRLIDDSKGINSRKDIEIKYLHQLQNLYYNLTGRELEI